MENKTYPKNSRNSLWFILLASFLCLLLLFSHSNSTLIVASLQNFSFSATTFSGSFHSESPNTTTVASPIFNRTIVLSPPSLTNYSKPTEENSTDHSRPQLAWGKDVDDEHEDPCLGRYIYVHALPPKFNLDLLKDCKSLIKWQSMCPYISNMGLGPNIHSLGNGWFGTNQFTLELIFHNRMKQYKCLTQNSSIASAVFVPFYAGLEVGRHLWDYNVTVRDSLALQLMKWLRETKEWSDKGMYGRNHFLVSGRIGWDFRRTSEKEEDWGSKMMSLPEAKNLTLLSIESTSSENDFAIPYPTYFHPSSDEEVENWQTLVGQNQKRKYLFSFAGAPRPSLRDSIRGEIISQCLASQESCKLLDCGNSNLAKKCESPGDVIKLFMQSTFCLQPPGDSYTRRSTFDSILAGCIPVFFHPRSAYEQYVWHLPENHARYSVYVPMEDVKDGEVNIEIVLKSIPRRQILEMREEVIKLIPRIIYANPNGKLDNLEDAFDIAVKGILNRVDKIRRQKISSDENA